MQKFRICDNPICLIQVDVYVCVCVDVDVDVDVDVSILIVFSYEDNFCNYKKLLIII